MSVFVNEMSRILYKKHVLTLFLLSLPAMGDRRELPRIGVAPPMKLSELLSEAMEKKIANGGGLLKGGITTHEAGAVAAWRK